jgi:thiol-disulfide isomerase/thioredoxin
MPPRRQRTWPLWLAAALCLIGAVGVVLRAGLPDPLDHLGETVGDVVYAPIARQMAPLIATTTADGAEFSLQALRGRPVVLNFWATWCAPCVAEMPELQRVQETFGDSVTVVGINTGESATVVREWAAARGITFPLVLDPVGAAATDYQLRGQPMTFVINAAGVVTDVLFGPTTADQLTRLLDPLIVEAA